MCRARLPDFRDTFGPLDAFDLVLAENGTSLLDPPRVKKLRLANLLRPPSSTGVKSLSLGHTIIATSEPNEPLAILRGNERVVMKVLD